MCNFLLLSLFTVCAQFVLSNQSSASVQSPTHTSLPQASTQVCKLLSHMGLKYTALHAECRKSTHSLANLHRL